MYDITHWFKPIHLQKGISQKINDILGLKVYTFLSLRNEYKNHTLYKSSKNSVFDIYITIFKI